MHTLITLGKSGTIRSRSGQSLPVLRKVYLTRLIVADILCFNEDKVITKGKKGGGREITSARNLTLLRELHKENCS